MTSAADISRAPANCHPERSLAVSQANRRTESRDPYYPYIIAAALGVSGNK